MAVRGFEPQLDTSAFGLEVMRPARSRLSSPSCQAGLYEPSALHSAGFLSVFVVLPSDVYPASYSGEYGRSKARKKAFATRSGLERRSPQRREQAGACKQLQHWERREHADEALTHHAQLAPWVWAVGQEVRV